MREKRWTYFAGVRVRVGVNFESPAIEKSSVIELNNYSKVVTILLEMAMKHWDLK
jgi:hypothetical protein